MTNLERYPALSAWLDGPIASAEWLGQHEGCDCNDLRAEARKELDQALRDVRVEALREAVGKCKEKQASFPSPLPGPPDETVYGACVGCAHCADAIEALIADMLNGDTTPREFFHAIHGTDPVIAWCLECGGRAVSEDVGTVAYHHKGCSALPED